MTTPSHDSWFDTCLEILGVLAAIWFFTTGEWTELGWLVVSLLLFRITTCVAVIERRLAGSDEEQS